MHHVGRDGVANNGPLPVSALIFAQVILVEVVVKLVQWVCSSIGVKQTMTSTHPVCGLTVQRKVRIILATT